MSAEDFKNGQILLIDKPLHWTSFQVVNKLRFAIKKKFKIKDIKVGHAGTLDPLATGLLIICTGKLTKTIDSLQAQAKEYTGTITLGGTTPSYDLETSVDQVYPYAHITDSEIYAATKAFLGEIEQLPPMFSAIKKDGVRMYELARKGISAEIKPRKITIMEFEITNIDLPEVDFRIVCSKGTYIRSLAHDFGKVLQTGSHLSALRRTKIGDYGVANAMDMNSYIGQLDLE
ncbi:MAG: tRNA pseudouridine(55) synthase TruB [Flavobacteriaceae bacterium]|nr:tRNA pseudouridine(55) synthase TruB [Flavobacteriaceae bacterium]